MRGSNGQSGNSNFKRGNLGELIKGTEATRWKLP